MRTFIALLMMVFLTIPAQAQEADKDETDTAALTTSAKLAFLQQYESHADILVDIQEELVTILFSDGKSISFTILECNSEVLMAASNTKLIKAQKSALEACLQLEIETSHPVAAQPDYPDIWHRMWGREVSG